MDRCTHEVCKQHRKDIIIQCNRWQRLIRREIFARRTFFYEQNDRSVGMRI